MTLISRLHLVRMFSVLSLLALSPLSDAARGETWLLVDTEALTLEVFDDDKSLLKFEEISIGRGGAARDKLKGDDRTPLGRYRVAWLNPNSRFRFFIGLDYPSRADVERAFRSGDLGAEARRRILDSLYTGSVPPQDTPLGGFIGIHGLGRADPDLHEAANWTEGCVALTNEQIDRLRRYVRIGTTVVIR
jgi:murein L,D-transpeptidase YafK